MMRNVRMKICLSLFLLSMSALLLVLAIVHQSSLNALRTNEIRYNVEATDRTRYIFSNLFDSVYKTVKLLSENEEVASALRIEDHPGDGQLTVLKNQLSTMLKNCIYPTQAICGVHIVGVQGWKFFSSMPSVDERALRDTCDALLSLGRADRYRFTGRMSIEYYPGLVQQVIQYVTPIYSLENGRLQGSIVVDIDYSVLEEMFLLSSLKNEDKALIVRENGEIIFNYPYNVTLDSVLEDYPQLLTQEECTIDGEVFGASMLIVSDTIDYTAWRMIRMISQTRITRETQSVAELTIKAGAAFFICSLIISVWLSGVLTRPIRQLAAAFRQAEDGNMDVRVHIQSRDEMASLGEMFNRMMVKLNAYFNRELEAQKKKSDMELEVLETQINPHFLYNTLDSIRWLAVLQNVDNIAQMTAALISLLRYNLSKDSPVATLLREVESVENYMRVQRYRYGAGLELTRSLSPDTLEMQMPRFLLQPLVENCILHAYGDMDEIGPIEITSGIRDDQLIIRVIDSGRGMADGSDAPAASGQKGQRFKNIGIPNIRERIRLYCGEGYGLVYRARPGGGTIAEINLPARDGRGESALE